MKTLEQLGISPAPWEVNQYNNIMTCYGHTLAATIISDAYGRDMTYKDACLIAAAPQLYEALQSLVEYIDRECIPCGENACELLDAAHNALAKAAGESETILQPYRGARRNAETTEATDPTHGAVRKG